MPLIGIAQDQPFIDSLVNKARLEPEDTNRVFFYYAIGAEYYGNNPVKANEYFLMGKNLSEKINYPRGLAGYYIKRGRMIEGSNLMDSARVLYDSAMVIYEDAGLTARYYSLCINVGNTYYIQGLYEKALPWYIKSAEGAQKINDANTVAQAYLNIGNIYYEQQQPEQATEYWNKAIPFAEQAENNNTKGSLLNNLGAIEFDAGNYNEALTYFQRGLVVRTKTLDGKEGAALCQSNIGECLFQLGRMEESIQFFQLAHENFGSIPDSISLADNMILWGNALYHMGEKGDGIAKMKEGLAIAETFIEESVMEHGYQLLAAVYKIEKNFQEAHYYLEKFDAMKDSVHARESSRMLVEMQTRYDVDEKEEENEQLRQEAEIKAVEDESFRRMIWGTVILLVVGAGALIITVAVKQRSNKMLAAKNALIEYQKKEITDSINYAQRIQQAILPDDRDFQNIFPDSFVLYNPKAIVSGDFWWMTSSDEYTFVAIADCTGHGVPGAFMSMLGVEMLNEISRSTSDPGEMLSKLNIGIKRALRQSASGESQSNDGMDIGLCRYNKNKSEVIFAGANRPLWIWSGNSLVEFQPTKSAIGGLTPDDQKYASNAIALSKNDVLYMFTDGFADQFGGDKGKKLKTSGLRAMVQEYSSLTMAAQQEQFSSRFHQWRGPLEQVDDVLISGIRI